MSIHSLSKENRIRRLICVEGIDGCGKDTQLKLLKDLGFTVGSEPMYDEPVGKLLKQILSGDTKLRDSATLEYLFAADRNEHVEQIMQYFIEEKKYRIPYDYKKFFYITGRYKYSGLAYTNDLWITQRLNDPLPEAGLIFYLKIDPKEAMDRINKNRTHTDIYENLKKLQETSDRYEKIFFGEENSIYRPNVCVLDATQTPEEICKQITSELEKYYNQFSRE